MSAQDTTQALPPALPEHPPPEIDSDGIVTTDSATTGKTPNISPTDARAAVIAITKTESNNPWKYAGYPQFSRWVASDQAWFITRRFSTLNARVILLLQDKIVELEDELDDLDKAYSQPNEIMGDDDHTHNGSFRLDRESHRTKVLDDLTQALSKYNSFVNDYSQLASRPSVRRDDVNAVRGWLDNHDGAIDGLEAAYIDRFHDDDLIPVHPKPRSLVRKFLEKTRVLRHGPLRWCLSRHPCDPEIRKRDRGQTIWHNDRRVEWLSGLVIGVAGLGMLIGPIWALYKVEPSNKRLGIISGFIVVFYFLVVIATTAKLFETLAAVAAYSAVLMVFMQIQK